MWWHTNTKSTLSLTNTFKQQTEMKVLQRKGGEWYFIDKIIVIIVVVIMMTMRMMNLVENIHREKETIVKEINLI